MLLPLGIVILGQVIGMVLAVAVSPFLAVIGSLIAMCGGLLAAIWLILMLLELKRFTQDEGFLWWLVFIPCVNYYLLWWLLPQQVAKAKQMAGLPNPPRHIVLYIFFALYALPADLNELSGG